MSDFSVMVDNIIEDILDNVALLQVDSQNVHRYDPASPEELVPDGSRHLAVWPTSDQPDQAVPLTMGSHQLNQMYRLLVWEDFPGSARQVSDTDATLAFLDLHNAVRARFYFQANQGRAGAFRVWYRGTQFPERSSSVRWFEMAVSVATAVAFD